jgi:2-dehydro-3-deoxy-D-arabinonate dehydratase
VPSWRIADVTDLAITVTVRRGDEVAWAAEASTALMHRGFADLVEHLFRQATFPHGVVLSTGTGLVPDLHFTLRAGDVVHIEIDGIGALTNSVHSASSFAWLTPRPDRTPA